MEGIERWLGDLAGRHGPLCIGVMAALLVCAVPLYVMSRMAPHKPELRVLATGNQLSALLADGDARVLLIDARDRAVARSALGRLTRPWEPPVTTLVAPADDNAAPGLLEALERTQPSGVVVVGLPGADPTWAEIEGICRERGIGFSIVGDESRLTTARLALSLLAGDTPTGGGAVIAQRGDMSVLFAFGNQPVAASGQLLVSNGKPSDRNDNATVLTSDPYAGVTQRVVVGTTQPIRVTIEPRRLRISGGALLGPQMVASLTPRGAFP